VLEVLATIDSVCSSFFCLDFNHLQDFHWSYLAEIIIYKGHIWLCSGWCLSSRLPLTGSTGQGEDRLLLPRYAVFTPTELQLQRRPLEDLRLPCIATCTARSGVPVLFRLLSACFWATRRIGYAVLTERFDSSRTVSVPLPDRLRPVVSSLPGLSRYARNGEINQLEGESPSIPPLHLYGHRTSRHGSFAGCDSFHIGRREINIRLSSPTFGAL